MSKAIILILVVIGALIIKAIDVHVRKVCKKRKEKKDLKSLSEMGSTAYYNAVKISTQVKSNASVYNYSQLDLMQINSLLVMQMELMDKMTGTNGFTRVDCDQLNQINPHLSLYLNPAHRQVKGNNFVKEEESSKASKGRDQEKRNNKKAQDYSGNRDHPKTSVNTEEEFFKGCKTKEQLKSRLKIQHSKN